MRSLKQMGLAGLAVLLFAAATPALAAQEEDDCVGSGKWPVGCTEFLANNQTVHHDEEWCCEHLGDEGVGMIGDLQLAPSAPRGPRYQAVAPSTSTPGGARPRGTALKAR